MTLAVWTNILNIAALNSWIVYKKASGRKISRRNFILQLIEGWRGAYVAQKVTWENTVKEGRVQRPSGKRRKCADEKFNNSTVSICQHCRKPTCGKCGNGNCKLTECKNCLLPQNWVSALQSTPKCSFRGFYLYIGKFAMQKNFF